MSGEAFRSRIGSALSNRDFSEVEAAWREYASLHPEDHGYLLGVASQLARHDKGPLAGELCLSLGAALLEQGQVDAAFDAARAALKASQRTEGLRDFLIAVYRARHGENDNLDVFLEKSGLSGEAGGLRGQVDSLDRYLTFEEGAYVYHRGGWGYGEVVEFDADDESMVIDFQRKKGHRMKLLSATKFLERLPRDHIGVYKWYRREELDELIENEPTKVFHLYLESNGREATLKQIREELAPDVIEKPKWSKWWGRAKKELLKDPLVRIGKGSSPKLELRDEAKPIEQEVAEKMRDVPGGIRKAVVAREYLRTLDLTDALADAVNGVATEALDGERNPSERLALLYLKADLKRDDAASAEEEAKRLLGETEDLHELLAPLAVADRKRAISDVISSEDPNWPEKVTAVLEAGDADIADTAFEHLRKARPDILVRLFANLSAQPSTNPPMFLWYAKALVNATIGDDLAPGEQATGVMEKLLTLADRIGLEQKRTGDAEQKEWLRRLRSFLTSRRMKMFQQFVEDANVAYARVLHSKIQRSRGFTDQTKGALLEVVEAEHPNLFATAEDDQPAAPTAVDNVIYTTLRGYHQKDSELKHVLEVEVPKNADDLGRAASFGDISENAEYSAALEKQERLMGRAREPRDALDRARLPDPHEVTTDRVVVGTRVRVKNKKKGAEEEFTLLGPWDADLDRGIISYMSPVGLGLLGKEQGEEVTIQLPSGEVTYEIQSIATAPMELMVEESV